jgi:hypothetical protein
MSEPIWSNITIMIDRPRPDKNNSEERRKLKEKIIEKGLKVVIDEIVDEYYDWETDPNPISARDKKRMTLIFSKEELRFLIPIKIHRLLGNFDFLPFDDTHTPPT